MNYTHKIIFKERGMQPESIDLATATSLMNAREQGQNVPFSLGGSQYMSQDIRAIVKLERQVTSSRTYPCTNTQCNREDRIHFEGTPCEYDTTGVCTACNGSVFEKHRLFSLYRFGRVMCYGCYDKYWTSL